MDCGTPFCQGMGCPVFNVIPEINDLVYRGRWREALQILISTNNFPEFTGRICPALCEGSCVLGLTDKPVAIRQIEKEVIERGFAEGWVVPKIPTVRTGKKAAVIGSGPAGLACAEELNLAGHLVTVYEKDVYPGGILRYGIPDFKLDKKIVERRIDLMEKAGIIFETNVAIGDEISGSFLKKRYDAVILTGGAREPRKLAVPGNDLNGIYPALDFLIQQNKLVSGEQNSGLIPSAEGKHVIVIGGGDTGSDCVGTSVRQKALSVTQLEIMPKPPSERASYTPWPYWPHVLRTSSSHMEGCIRRWSVSTINFKGNENKNIENICISANEWKQNGKTLHPVIIPGTEETLPAQMVLIAMGFTGPARNPLFEQLNITFDEKNNIATDSTFMTVTPGIFSAGDMNTGASLVVRSIYQGRKAAYFVNNYLQNCSRLPLT